MMRCRWDTYFDVFLLYSIKMARCSWVAMDADLDAMLRYSKDGVLFWVTVERL